MTPEELADVLLHEPIEKETLRNRRYVIDPDGEKVGKRLIRLIYKDLIAQAVAVNLWEAKQRIDELFHANTDPTLERAREDSDMTLEEILGHLSNTKLYEIQKNNPGQITLETMAYGTGIVLRKLLEE
jgi:hypothetical protein